VIFELIRPMIKLGRKVLYYESIDNIHNMLFLHNL
jgi:hypothetical protein